MAGSGGRRVVARRLGFFLLDGRRIVPIARRLGFFFYLLPANTGSATPRAAGVAMKTPPAPTSPCSACSSSPMRALVTYSVSKLRAAERNATRLRGRHVDARGLAAVGRIAHARARRPTAHSTGRHRDRWSSRRERPPHPEARRTRDRSRTIGVVAHANLPCRRVAVVHRRAVRAERDAVRNRAIPERQALQRQIAIQPIKPADRLGLIHIVFRAEDEAALPVASAVVHTRRQVGFDLGDRLDRARLPGRRTPAARRAPAAERQDRRRAQSTQAVRACQMKRCVRRADHSATGACLQYRSNRIDRSTHTTLHLHPACICCRSESCTRAASHRPSLRRRSRPARSSCGCRRRRERAPRARDAPAAVRRRCTGLP